MDLYPYRIVGFIFGILVFILAWIYGVMLYGAFLGIGLCWIPAFFIGCMAGLALAILCWFSVEFWPAAIAIGIVIVGMLSSVGILK